MKMGMGMAMGMAMGWPRCLAASPVLTHSCRTFHAGVGASSARHSGSFSRVLLTPTTPTPSTATSPPPPSKLAEQQDSSSFASRLESATIRPRFPPALFHRRRFYSTAARMPPNASEWPAARVRKTFFDFFAERGHTVGESTMPRQLQ